MVVFDASLFRLMGSLVALAALFAILLAISVIDWRTRRIPNALIITLIMLRLVVLGADVVLGSPEPVLKGFAESLVTAFLFVGALLALKGMMERSLHKDCMGLGDVKLLGAGCLFLDLEQAMVALALASVMDIAIALYVRVTRGEATFPFGPALCCGLFVALFL